MVTLTFSLREDYWDTFKLEEEDIEFLYNHLLELETPLTSEDLVKALISDRIRREKLILEQQRTAGGDLYYPKDIYSQNQNLIFPGMEWQRGKVIGIRPGYNPDIGVFQVINVAFEDGDEKEFASGLANHRLNQPPEITEGTNTLTEEKVLVDYSSQIIEILEDYLQGDTDFVRIAWRWFPRALLVDINVGHLNLAEAVLDMVDGGPLPTLKLLEQIELSADVNPKLVEFSLDLALQEDSRFDEVGPAGDILWFLQRLEPQEVQTPPIYLRYSGIDYDRLILTEDMLALERELDDELSPLEKRSHLREEEEIRLIFPHWISGTLPLSSRIQHLFPTAYEAPRIQFVLVDGNSGDRYPAWVVRETRYIYGLKDWYDSIGLIPGSTIKIRKGTKPDEVIIQTDSRRSSREWIRTVLIGSDSGVVFAMLKQIISAPFDDRMAISIPDQEAISQIWQNIKKEKPPFERVVVNMVKELAKLNPQSHVHISELYAAINVVLRCPPGPILALLASRPWFAHVGDLHYRLNDSVDI